MRRNVLHLVSTLAGVGLLATAGCSVGGDARSLGPVPTAPPTTVVPTTTVPPTTSTTLAVSASSTTRPPVTAATSTTVRPVVVDGVPQVTASPSRAGVGARVRVEGTGFTDTMWKASGATLWLAEKGGCNLYAEAEHSISVSAGGRLTGEFTVPATGACRMTTSGERPVIAGVYRIVYTCTACAIGELEVTGTSATPCADVVFSPNSENMASGIVATGFASCADAEAFVRRVGVQLRAVGGPAELQVDNFACARTAESDRALPSADYRCSSGLQTVYFHRT
jgi:hypothetical protein